MFNRALILISLIAAPLVATAQEAPTQEVVEKFDAWSKICVTNSDQEKPPCQIVQSATQNATGSVVFQTAVGYIADNDKPLMFMTAPLGIFLPKGITVVVDDDEQGLTVPVQRCDAKGCLAVLVMERDFVRKLERGDGARAIFAANAERNVALPIDLTGFRKAFRSVRP